MEQHYQNSQQQHYNLQTQENLPNAVAVLVLGILSLLNGCLGVGLVLGIIGVVLSKKGMAAYAAEPTRYKGYGMLNAGRVMSIIGIVLGAISLFVSLIGLIAGFAYFEWIFDLLDI